MKIFIFSLNKYDFNSIINTNVKTLILFILFSLYLSQEANTTKNGKEDPSVKIAELEEKFGKSQSTIEDSPDELAKKREENEKHFYEQINQALKDLGIENTKIITRDQFKKIFMKLLESDKDKERNKTEEKEEDLTLIRGLADQIFDNLISKDKDYIEVDKIMEYFQPQNIINALKAILKGLGLDSLVEAFSEPLMEALGGSFLKNNEKKAEEKSSDL